MNAFDSKSFRKEFEYMMNENNLDTVIVLSHVNADGDAVGSVLSLSYYLDELYPKIKVIPYLSEIEGEIRTIINTDKKFRDVFSYPKIEKEKEYAVIVCDTAIEEKIEGKIFFCGAKATMAIDHHLQNEKYANINFIDYREACSEVIYSIIDWTELLKTTEKKVLTAIAQYIYIGIIHDTGCFKRIDKYTFEIASDLISIGVEHKKIVETMHAYTFEELKRQNNLLDKAEVFADHVTFVYMKQAQIIENHYTYYDLHKLPDILRNLKDVKIAFVFFEEENGMFKCLMRSKEHNVNELLKRFGGGGHKLAASFKVQTNEPDTVLANVLEEISDIL